MKEFEASSSCYNCKATLLNDAKFCHSCGQKYTTGKITVGRIIGDFFANYFNLDSKLPKSIIPLLFQPGKLTKEYFQGKHKSYILPVQLFIVSLALFFATVIYMNQNFVTGLNFNNKHDQLLKQEEKIAIQQKIDTLLLDVKSNVLDSTVHFVLDTTFQSFLKRDSILFSDSINMSITPEINANNELVSNEFSFSTKDAFLLQPDEVIEKYKVEEFWTQLFVKQSLKTLRNERSFFNEFLNKLSWMSIFLMPFFALILQMLYVRQKRFYVEHLIFAFHYHALLFILLTMSLLFGLYENHTIAGLLRGYAILYLFFALKLYYGQNYGKTFLKFFLLFITYAIIIVIALVITTGINLVLL